MIKQKKRNTLLSGFKKDTQGNIAVMFALVLSTTLMAVGSAIDISLLQRVKSQTQFAVDQIALSQAVFYTQHGRAPKNNEEGYVNSMNYSPEGAGYDLPGSVYGMTFNAFYDTEKGEVKVTMAGQNKTVFIGMVSPKYDSLVVRSVAVAKFDVVQVTKPVSIAMVLDNSASMGWDDKPGTAGWRFDYDNWQWTWGHTSPDDAIVRLDGLKSSLGNFMNELGGSSNSNTLRTGLIPFNQGIVTPQQVNMKWGGLSRNEINAMRAEGSTDTSYGVIQARKWLKDEEKVHKVKKGENDPLRYLILMTDGQNSGLGWKVKSGTGIWRGVDCRSGNGCLVTIMQSVKRPKIPHTHAWKEGESNIPADHETKYQCSRIKKDGVRVFTIGFALEPGDYVTNRAQNNRPVSEVHPSYTYGAYDVLSDCASSDEDFIIAKDAEALNKAFEDIAKTVADSKNVVRISR